MDDQTRLTDLAREKAQALGIRLRPSATRSGGATGPSSNIAPAGDELIGKVKARVIARLGTTAYNAILDQVIPQVLAQIDTGSVRSTSAGASAEKPGSGGGGN